jgi:hypothetical protein
MRVTLAIAFTLVVSGCAKRPPVYDQQIAGCGDEVRKDEQLRSVSGHEDEIDLQRKKDAVALAEYFRDHCFPNSFDPPAADEPSSGTVGQIINYQRKAHNKKFPQDLI